MENNKIDDINQNLSILIEDSDEDIDHEGKNTSIRKSLTFFYDF